MAKEKMKFVGIVDRKWIESFYSLEEAIAKDLVSFLALRAHANAWRGAKTYCVELDSAEKEKIESLLQDRKWVEAGRLIRTIILAEVKA
jgi:hypothetical protein